MKIEKLILANFRSFENEIEIPFKDLNVFVGKNDVGKSTVLEALDIFLNENKGVIKIDKDDINSSAKEKGNTNIIIGVVFSDLPKELTIDSTNPTRLEDEYLLGKDGKLTIIKKYPNAGKEKVFVKAFHPTCEECSDLLLKKQSELRLMLTDDMICKDRNRNAAMRAAIWTYYSDSLDLQEIEIELAKIDAKNSWEQIKQHLPVYSLFQSDRKNSDGDSEIQNPMKLAVEEILKDQRISDKLNEVANEVEEKLRQVALQTLDKLNEMNPDIANSLSPVIPSSASLKWVDVFKSVTITGDENIPINKRGSGVKRLVLLNFFRAEAERRADQVNLSNIIYAIEEPETSQHPDHQRKLIDAFIKLSQSENTQVIMTSHSPAIVKMLDFEHLKLIKPGSNKELVDVERNELPYPSLNEVNFLAFGESDEEYHNELYGFIESEGLLGNYKINKDSLPYIKILRGNPQPEQHITLSEYIRHQIHHPENTLNKRFTQEQLQSSINCMRSFIQLNMSKGSPDG